MNLFTTSRRKVESRRGLTASDIQGVENIGQFQNLKKIPRFGHLTNFWRLESQIFLDATNGFDFEHIQNAN